MIKIRIKNEELTKELVGKDITFPKYTTQLINLANQNAQGTRARVVGQLSELIKECPENELEKWKEWYEEKYPLALENATDKIFKMVINLKQAIELIDRDMVRRWVEDLVINKTFTGFKFQKVILKRIASIRKTDYKLASPEEESKGIDGYIGGRPVSIKPVTYKTKNMLPEKIEVPIIYYNKTKAGLTVEFKNF